MKNHENHKTMAIEQAADWMSRLQATDPPDWENPGFLQWMSESHIHREAFADVSATWFDADELDPNDFQSEQMAPTFLPRQSRPWRVWAAAALVLAVVLLPNWDRHWNRINADHFASPGEMVNLTLPDGSRLMLAGDAALDSWHTDNARGVRLRRGELFLDVTHDPNRPFTVSAGDAEIQVLGTRFGVSVRDGELRTGLLEGSIELRAGGAQQILAPGGQLQVTANGLIVADRYQPDEYFSWHAGQLVFRNRPLTEVLDRLEPFLGQTILVPWGGDSDTVSAVIDLDNIPAGIHSLAEQTNRTVSVLAGVYILN